MRYSQSQILAVKIEGKTLGSSDTISKDMKIIQSRWLDNDPEWFHRARVARVEAKFQLVRQVQRLNQLIVNILDGKYNETTTESSKNSTATQVPEKIPNKVVAAESQLTTVIKTLYEIDADFDPEQYLDTRIKESINDKIEKAELV